MRFEFPCPEEPCFSVKSTLGIAISFHIRNETEELLSITFSVSFVILCKMVAGTPSIRPYQCRGRGFSLKSLIKRVLNPLISLLIGSSHSMQLILPFPERGT
jgi:hypothetical protein